MELDACTDYDFKIIPSIDDYMSEDDEETAEVHKNITIVKSKTSGIWILMPSDDPQYQTFLNQALTTLPSAAVLSSLSLDVQPNDDQVTISWSVPAEIS